MRTCLLALALTVVLVPSCGGDAGPEDTGGGGMDVPRLDTGSPPDSGGVDGGTELDVGMADPDVPPGLDAGGGDDAPGEDAPTIDAPIAMTDGGITCSPACAAPFSCTPAGYCASATGVPAFDHVYVAIFENRSRANVIGHAPYLDSLAAMGAQASRYLAVTHPSLPNYIAMTSGSFWGDGCDCHPGPDHSCSALTCNLLLRSCTCEHNVTHLGDQLDVLGIGWREYGEDMGSPCNITDSGRYAAKHLPFLYYSNVLTDSARCTMRVRDYGDFAADLAARSYRFSVISPNLCNDMHDSCTGDPIAQGDTWARANLAPILSGPGFGPGGRDALFVVFDEEEFGLTPQPIPFIVVSPLAVSGLISDRAYNHYSLLATWEDAFGAPRLVNAATATPIDDIWR